MYKRYHLVKAEPLGWGVPTVHRLWFGYVKLGFLISKNN